MMSGWTGAFVVTALMPLPASLAYGDSWLYVKGGFQVEWWVIATPC